MQPTIHRNAYTLVLHKHGDLLYRGVEECVANKLKLVEADVATTTNERLLEDLVGKWETHKITMNMIRDVLMYMVRNGRGAHALLRAKFCFACV